MSSNSPNRDTSRAWAYHNSTKHTEWSVRANQHYLDWNNQPLPLKIYTTVDPLPLPRDADQTGISALSAISASGIPTDVERLPTLQDLARILYFSAGITKKKTYSGGEIYFRAASCTGALYEFELYVVCADLPDLKAGVYHFGPGDYTLRLLRSGDYRGVLRLATAGESSITHAPVTIICTGIYWRNAWKYGSRTYRHFGWDNGTMLANLLAMTSALELPSRVVLGFEDLRVNQLIDVDTNREVAFSLVSIGYIHAEPPPAPQEILKLNLPTVPLSQTEVDYPELRDIHEASSLHSSDEVSDWRRRAGELEDHAAVRDPRDISAGLSALSTDSIERVILRRGSTRRFAREPITMSELSSILAASTQGIWPGFPLMNDLYLIVNAVDGLSSGAYFYPYKTGELECLKPGNFRSQARYLDLQQDLAGDAAADVFFMSELQPILERWGNRGYRAAQLEAGILGGKMYLAAYAQHLGATGLTFFDDDVTEFFSPHAKGKSAIFLVALGKAWKAR